jgi:cellulose synthase/poly-beta-1,6-N-acetylglucosamine synthase-like glycosyltransferase
MAFFVATLLCFAIVVFLIPVLVLLIQVVIAFPLRQYRQSLSERRPRVAILIPAHNEEVGVSATIASLVSQLVAGDRMLVVADNCTDGTATAAIKAGAEVRERTDLIQRGKGYALDFGVRCLAADAPEVLIIIDADCIAAPTTIDHLARTALQSGRPVQSLNLMQAPPGSGPLKKIAEFAWIVKNLVRPLGYFRLGLPCQLMGTGMAFPWAAISSASLATSSIVEDMKLGMEFANAGLAPLFCPNAKITSMFPVSASGVKAQRTRWEHGHISMILKVAPKLLAQGVANRNIGLMALVFDICVPPLALLTMLVVLLSMVSGVFGVMTKLYAPALLAGGVLAALGIAILLAWWRYGRQKLSAGNLVMAFIYMMWKIPLYIGFFVRRQVEWVRAKRDSE